MKLTIRSGTLPCPNVAPLIQPVASFTETGFKPTDRLNVTAILPLTSSTSPEEVCFRSVVPFKSQSNPSVATAGTAFLLNCSQVANMAPCVTSSTQVGSNVVVKFVVPGADPDFCIKLRNGRQAWLSRLRDRARREAVRRESQHEWRDRAVRLECRVGPASRRLCPQPPYGGDHRQAEEEGHVFVHSPSHGFRETGEDHGRAAQDHDQLTRLSR